MANAAAPFGARPMDEVKQELLGRARENRNPFLYTLYDEVAPVIHELRSVDREEWAKAFSALAFPHEQRAAQAEMAGDVAKARAEYLIAYDCYHVARYPAPNSAGKLSAYKKSQENFHKALDRPSRTPSLRKRDLSTIHFEEVNACCANFVLVTRRGPKVQLQKVKIQHRSFRARKIHLDKHIQHVIQASELRKRLLESFTNRDSARPSSGGVNVASAINRNTTLGEAEGKS